MSNTTNETSIHLADSSKKSLLKNIIRISIGLFFMVSAVFKLLSIDEFEIYIYSFGVVNFAISSFFARLVIGFELVTGTLFILKFYYKKIWLLLLITTIGFTLFLIYTAIFRSDSNCHCMGEIVKLNPAFSIIKNIVIIVLLFVIRKDSPFVYRFRVLISGILLFAGMLLPFVLFPPDSIYRYFVKGEKTINLQEFEKSVADTSYDNQLINIKLNAETNALTFSIEKNHLNISNDTFLFMYMHSGCEYCKLAMKKIKLIFDNNNIDKSKCKILIWGDDEHISDFIRETESMDFEFRKLDPFQAVGITNGKFPTFAIVEKGKIITDFNFRSIDESMIVENLK